MKSDIISTLKQKERELKGLRRELKLEQDTSLRYARKAKKLTKSLMCVEKELASQRERRETFETSSKKLKAERIVMLSSVKELSNLNVGLEKRIGELQEKIGKMKCKEKEVEELNETIREMRKKKGKLLEVQLITDSTLHTLKRRCTIAEERLEKTIESETLLKNQLEKALKDLNAEREKRAELETSFEIAKKNEMMMRKQNDEMRRKCKDLETRNIALTKSLETRRFESFRELREILKAKKGATPRRMRKLSDVTNSQEVTDSTHDARRAPPKKEVSRPVRTVRFKDEDEEYIIMPSSPKMKPSIFDLASDSYAY
eukprot:g633.t1